MVVEAEHLVHQGVAGVDVAMGTARPRLRLCLDVQGVDSMARFLLSSLGIETLTGSHLTPVALLDLALLIRCDLKKVVLVGMALLVMAGWEVLITWIDLLILCWQLESFLVHEVWIESLEILQNQLLSRLLLLARPLLRLALCSLLLRWEADRLVQCPGNRALSLLLVRRLEDAALLHL